MSETAMSEPGVTRPGEAAVGQEQRNDIMRHTSMIREQCDRTLDAFAAAVRAEERERTLAAVFDAISGRLGIAGDQTARMICLGAIKATAARLAREEPTE